MQWMAIWSKSSASGTGPPIGLYIGAHDPIGHLQLMIIRMGRYPNITDPGAHKIPRFTTMHLFSTLSALTLAILCVI